MSKVFEIKYGYQDHLEGLVIFILITEESSSIVKILESIFELLSIHTARLGSLYA